MTDRPRVRIRITKNYRFEDCVDKWVMEGQTYDAILLPDGRAYVKDVETIAGRHVVATLPPDVWEKVE